MNLENLKNPVEAKKTVENDSEQIAKDAMEVNKADSISVEELNNLKSVERKSADEKIAAIREIVGTETSSKTASIEAQPVMEEKTEEKKEGGMFSKLKSLFNKELSPEERAQKNNKKADEFIRNLTHIKSFDTGLGGLGNFSGGVDNSLDFLNGCNPETVNSIGEKLAELSKVNKDIDNVSAGPEKVALTIKKRDLTLGIASGVRRAMKEAA